MILRLLFLFLLLQSSFLTYSQDNILSELVEIIPLQLSASNELPHVDTLNQIEQDLIRKQVTDLVPACADCQRGMFYALAKLYGYANDTSKTRYFLNKTGNDISGKTDQSLVAGKHTLMTIETVEKAYQESVAYYFGLDDWERIEKRDILFFTGYMSTFQYYFAKMATQQAQYKHITIATSEGWIETLSLFYDIFEPKLSNGEKPVLQQLNLLMDLFDQAKTDHLALTHFSDPVVTIDPNTSCHKLIATPLVYDNFEWECTHIPPYQQQLLQLLLSF